MKLENKIVHGSWKNYIRHKDIPQTKCLVLPNTTAEIQWHSVKEVAREKLDLFHQNPVSQQNGDQDLWTQTEWEKYTPSEKYHYHQKEEREHLTVISSASLSVCWERSCFCRQLVLRRGRREWERAGATPAQFLSPSVWLEKTLLLSRTVRPGGERLGISLQEFPHKCKNQEKGFDFHSPKPRQGRKFKLLYLVSSLVSVWLGMGELSLFKLLYWEIRKWV